MILPYGAGANGWWKAELRQLPANQDSTLDDWRVGCQGDSENLVQKVCQFGLFLRFAETRRFDLARSRRVDQGAPENSPEAPMH